jgi:hypothetical protein
MKTMLENCQMKWEVKCGLLCLVCITLCGCQAYNSASLDPLAFGAITPLEKARSVFSAHCASCHDFHIIEPAVFISRGIIVAKHPEQSEILLRLKGAGYDGPEDMPPSGSSASIAEVHALEAWINSL